MELGTSASLEPFSDVRHDRHRGALHLTRESEVFGKRAPSGGPVDLASQNSSLLPGDQVLKPLHPLTHPLARSTPVDSAPYSPLIPHSSFLTPHSSFLIPHSSFLIPHSSFLIPHSSFLIPHSSFLIPHSSAR